MADRHEDERTRRLAAALRENLKRRKAQGRAQERARDAGVEGRPPVPADPGAGPDDSGPAVAETTLPPGPDAP